jgi:transcription antitermination factor NusG
MNTSDEKWFVLITKPRAEKSVGKSLTKMGITNYVPVQKQLRQWHDRKKWVEVPVFNSYVFVLIPEAERKQVFQIKSILRYLTFGGEPASLRPQEIERIKALCAYTGEIHLNANRFILGEKVQVTVGPFIGFIGTLVSMDSKDKLQIEFPQLNCSALVEIDRKYCEKFQG